MVPLKQERTGHPLLNLSSVLKGVLVALIITILGCALLGVVYHVTSVTEKTLPLAATVLFYVSIFAGSASAARDAGCKGLLHGIGVAVVFVALAWLMSVFLLQVQGKALSLLVKGLTSCLAGGAGGILGVGLSR